MRISACFEAFVRAPGVDFTNKFAIVFLQIIDSLSDELQDVIGFLARNSSPFEREAALARDDVLRRAAVDYSDVDCRVSRIETCALIAFQLC